MLSAQGEVTRTFRHREASLACAPASFVFNVRLCFRSFRSFRSRGFSRCFSLARRRNQAPGGGDGQNMHCCADGGTFQENLAPTFRENLAPKIQENLTPT